MNEAMSYCHCKICGETDTHQADVPQDKPEKTIQLDLRTKAPGVCRGCLQPIDWYTTPAGKAMPMNARTVAIRTSGTRPVLGGHGVQPEMGEFLASDTHWATCPVAAKFHRGKR